MKCKFAVLFPKLLTNVAPCSLEMVPLGELPFRPMLKVKLTSSVLKQTLLGKNQGAAPMRTVLRNMNAQVKEKLQKLFNSAYFISKENLALTEWIEMN